MANKRVGVYRKYLEAVPVDLSGKPVPKSDWPKKRSFCWVARWFSAEGKRHSRSFRTKRQAQSFAAQKEIQIQDAQSAGLTAISLRGFHIEHKELTQGNVAARTLALHLATLGSLAGFLGWERPLPNICPRDIERFRAGRLSIGISAGTANKDITVLKRLFNLAILRGYLRKGSNPCDGVPKLKIGSVRKDIIGPEPFAGIYNCTADTFWRAFLATLYTAGLRLREATNLTWCDIDFDSYQLHITRKKAVGLVQAWTPKDYQMRMIPLPAKTVNLLTAWQSLAPEGCPYVFMGQSRWAYYRRQVERGRWRAGQDLLNNLLKRFKGICRRAGIRPYTLHDIRRTCITNWAGQLPIHVVQQLAGHSDMRTTQRYYLSVQPQDLDKARAIQASLLGTIPEDGYRQSKAG
jgi:integrase